MKKIIVFICGVVFFHMKLSAQPFPALKFEGGNNEPAWNSNFTLATNNCQVEAYWIGPNMNTRCLAFPDVDGELNFITVNAGNNNFPAPPPPMFQLNITGWQVPAGAYFLSMKTRHRFTHRDSNNIITNNTLDVFVGNTFITTIAMPRNNEIWTSIEYAINVPPGVSGTLSIRQVQNGNYQSNDYSIDNVRLCACALPRAIFTFEDGNHLAKDNFCPGEQIFLNGTPSVNEDGYQITVWSRLISAGPWAPFTNGITLGGAGFWFNGQQVGNINLTNAYANNNPQLIFTQGFEYKVQLAVFNMCSDWEHTERNFTVNCPCNPVSTFGCFTNSVGRRGLLWNPVPGASSYQVQIVLRDPNCCPGGTPFTLPVINTTNTFIILDPDVSQTCFSWQVTTICSNGNTSVPSARQCYMPSQYCGPQRLGVDGRILITNIRSFPNPVKSGELTITIEGEDETSITILQIQSIDGRVQRTLSITGNREEKVDVTDLANGMYILRALQNNAPIHISKFIKE